MSEQEYKYYDSSLIFVWSIVILMVLYLARGFWKNYKSNTRTPPTSIVISSSNSVPELI